MKDLLKQIFNKIGFSVLEGNKHSTARIQSYIVLIPILLMTITFLGFEITTFGMCIYSGTIYKISSEIIVIFGMLLSHHLAVLFSRKKSQSIKDIKGDNTLNEKTKEA